MFLSRTSFKTLVLATVVSVFLQGFAVKAEQAKKYETIIDVSLTSEGHLNGKVVNVSQEAMSGSEVIVTQGSTEIVRTATNENGEFTIKDLNQGVYKLTSADGVGYFRVWESNNAPPVVEQGATLIAERQVVRGLAPAILIGLIATAAIVGGAVAIANNNDSDFGDEDEVASP
jgi:hypothetical protein